MEQQAQIFKKRDAEDIFYGVNSFNFEALEARAKSIIERAYAEAEAQIQRAATEVDKIRADIRGQEFEAARQEGYAKGFAEGSTKGEAAGKEQAYSQVYVELKKSVDATPETLKSLINQLETHRKKLTEEAEKDLLSLAFAIGERIARVKIETDSKVVQQTLKEAIELVLNRNTLDVFIAPDDAHAIEEYLPQVRKMYSDIETLRVHSDPKISRGSTEIHTARGKVSIHVEDLIDSIANYLVGAAPSQVLERIMAQFGGDDEEEGDDTDRPMGSDEIALAEALQGEYEEDAKESKKRETTVFMEDSFLDSVPKPAEGEADEDAAPTPAPSSGAFTRVFTSMMRDEMRSAKDVEDEEAALVEESAAAEAAARASQAAPQAEAPQAAEISEDASDDPFGDILGEAEHSEDGIEPVEDSEYGVSESEAESLVHDVALESKLDPMDEMLATAASDEEGAGLGEFVGLGSDDDDDDLQAGAGASVEDDLFGDILGQAESDDMAGDLVHDVSFDAGTSSMGDDLGGEPAASEDDLFGDMVGFGGSTDDLSFGSFGASSSGGEGGGGGGLSDLDAALAELGGLRSEAKMDFGSSILGEEEPQEEEKPFMQDSFLEDLFGN